MRLAIVLVLWIGSLGTELLTCQGILTQIGLANLTHIIKLPGFPIFGAWHFAWHQ